MSNLPSAGSDATAPRADEPASPLAGIALGFYFLALAAVVFYVLVATWPVRVPASKDSSDFAGFYVLAWGPFSAASDYRFLFTVIAAGALGSLIHTLTSFADFMGNRALSKSWIWWFILRTPIGIALALLFYVALRGGLIVPTLPGGSPGSDATSLLNPYGIAAISALAGMFSKQATDKLREIFDTLFRTQEPVNRADPLTRVVPVIAGIEPAQLSVGGAVTLKVLGRSFQPDSTALINGKPRNVERVSDTLLKLTLLKKDLAAKGELQLVVRTPGAAGGSSEPFTIPVESQ